MAIALSVAFTPTPEAANNVLVIEATAQVSAGKRFQPRSAYKFIQQVAAAGASPADILSAYTAKFGALLSGTKIFFRLSSISTTTGERSAFLYTSQIVT